ncbi:hypothetical protein [Chamaesiphon sp. GL140_3_metabinner_50]|uniref:hypothetical protein n=1 Tax=Chamaesiphon sp. GL140_3_metabinner_50 TaxID=2970812 RepID=UPI0025E0C564|nr:hypothetical protein [Chamaesiphon sp. GL140_3_metabinner_50]
MECRNTHPDPNQPILTQGSLRGGVPPLARGGWGSEPPDPGSAPTRKIDDVFVRTWRSTEILVAVNVGPAAVKINLALANLASTHSPSQLFGTAKLDLNRDPTILTIDLHPRCGCILA